MNVGSGVQVVAVGALEAHPPCPCVVHPHPLEVNYSTWGLRVEAFYTLHPPGTPGIPTGRPSRNRSRCTISPRASPRKVPCKQENNELTQKDILFNTKNLRLRQRKFWHYPNNNKKKNGQSGVHLVVRLCRRNVGWLAN